MSTVLLTGASRGIDKAMVASRKTSNMQSLYIKSKQNDYTVDFLDDVETTINTIRDIPNRFVMVDNVLLRDAYFPLLSTLKVNPNYLMPITATEQGKTLQGVARIINELSINKATKQTVLVAIGGGIVQDLATLVAHIYHSGIRLVLVPTTLLSQADSCIGAKCGINTDYGKNQIGVFHSPISVLSCIHFLDTLTETEITSGYGEIFKLLFLSNKLDMLKASLDRGGFMSDQLPNLIYSCLETKKSVIEKDEYEEHTRHTLNYGHTFGHALEIITNSIVPHGIAVAWGMDVINYISWKYMLALSGADFNNMHKLIYTYIRPTEYFTRPDVDDLFNAVVSDKKTLGGNNIRFAIPYSVGDVAIIKSALNQELKQCVTEYLNEFHRV